MKIALQTNNLNKQPGFTLVELMIALTISLILLAGIITIFLGNKQTYNTTEALGRMQESARFALDTVTRNVREAGFLPCRLTGRIGNTLETSPAQQQAFDFFGSPLMGFDNSGAFPADFPQGNAVGDMIPGSDGVRIIKGTGPTYTVGEHNEISARITVQGTHDIMPDDVLLICDTTSATIFQATNANQGTTPIVHNTGAGSTFGNCSKGLGTPTDCNSTNGNTKKFLPPSQIVRLESSIYYIGRGASPNTSSLFRRVLTASGTLLNGTPQEIVEGVETMQILYGEAPNANGTATRFVPANLVGDFNNVVSVRIGLLMRTANNIGAQNDARVYNVADANVGPNTLPVGYVPDRRQRYNFSTTIKIRNRGTNPGS